MKIKKFVFLAIFIALTFTVYCQAVLPKDSLSLKLSLESQKIWQQKTDTARIKASQEFSEIFYQYLLNDRKCEHLFDSIVGITETHTENNTFQIFTWNIPLGNGLFLYKGFVRILNKDYYVITLNSTNSELLPNVNSLIKREDWYGALYYKVIENKIGNTNKYTVLGWDGCNNILNRKIIDVFNFENDSTFQFGESIFKTPSGIQARVVLEYAEKANCTLRYDFQSINVQKGNRIKSEKYWMIIMDRLIPMDPSLKGISKYYVPSGDTYDGYLFKDGYWCMVEEVDVRNIPIKTSNTNK